MAKQMVSWRLEPELLGQLDEEARELKIDMTALVEQKLGVPHWAKEMLTLLRRVDRKLNEER